MGLISMRGHHLVCLNFFNGEGYPEEFVRNLYEVIEKLNHEKVIVVEGADDVCKKCPFLINGICKDEEEIAEMDKTALSLLNLQLNDKVRWSEIKEKIPKVFKNWYDFYCSDCFYLHVCSKNSLFLNLTQI